MKSSPGTETPVPAKVGSKVYCPGCNALFRVHTDDGFCPRCRMPAATFEAGGAHLPTLLWKAGPRDLSEDVDLDEDRVMKQLVGREIGIYQCESLLGRGGMGWVFLARHRDLGRACAVKFLSPRLIGRDDDYVDRFMHEGQAAAALVHPNIVTTHAIGRHEDLHFLEMEYVGGRSLQHLLDTSQLSVVRAAVLAAQIASGLDAAHREGILHRDLKPDNVLMTHRGIPKISDFGLAKRTAGSASTGRGEPLVGTPNYMAPELFSGQPATPASDVYSLGVCLYVMLTGRLPFARPRLNELIQTVTTEPLPGIREQRRDVSLEVAECVHLMLAKSPLNRPRDGAEAMQLIQAVLGQVRDLHTLLEEALACEPNVSRTKTATGEILQVKTPDGRGQTVHIEQTDHSPSDRLLMIYSVCCPATVDYFEAALRLNATVCHGALAIRNVEGRDHFVMIDTYPRATVDPEEIRRSVLEVAAHADAVEAQLTGLDRN